MNEKEFYVRCQWGNYSFTPSFIIFMGNTGFCTSVVSPRDVELNISDKKCLPLCQEAFNRRLPVCCLGSVMSPLLLINS